MKFRIQLEIECPELLPEMLQEIFSSSLYSLLQGEGITGIARVEVEDLDIRERLNQLVSYYCQMTGRSRRSVWQELYQEFALKTQIDVPTRSRWHQVSAYEYLKQERLESDFYAIALGKYQHTK